jgi:hypothetical protein
MQRTTYLFEDSTRALDLQKGIGHWRMPWTILFLPAIAGVRSKQGAVQVALLSGDYDRLAIISSAYLPS